MLSCASFPGRLIAKQAHSLPSTHTHAHSELLSFVCSRFCTWKWYQRTELRAWVDTLDLKEKTKGWVWPYRCTVTLHIKVNQSLIIYIPDLLVLACSGMCCVSESLPPDWRAPSGEMQGNSLMGLIGETSPVSSYQSIMLNSHQSIIVHNT